MPGYQGLIPGMVSSAPYSKRYTEHAKELLANQELGLNRYRLSTTGFNRSKHDFVDPSKSAWTHKYGAQTNQRNHPCIDVSQDTGPSQN
jgi:hypothetical protein